ncbi:hypothetical protein LTR84_005811 [Exophiala bonariae]|uniref:Uncharacterized protein n=1 Tax=Exophiala bonariae TaxID=1690606 RepID=A0AAV9N3Q7_9EURO|nr:hypothetical protein LTR84_005811 [Exophiala bonariae]
MTSNPTFGAKTSAFHVAELFSSRIKGKIALVTGASVDTLGEQTARAFAHGGASTVIITGRDGERLSALQKSLASEYPSTGFRSLDMDLASFKSIRRAAKEILDDDSIPRIDFLIANAAMALVKEHTFTEDGLELSFGVNHIGHFLLIVELFPKIRKAAQASTAGETRIIILTSGAMFVSPVRFSDYNFERKPLPEDEQPNWELAKQTGATPTDGYHMWISYGASKSANTLLALHLNKLLSKRYGIQSYAVHPGTVGTRGVKALPFDAEQVKALGFMKTIDQGTSTTMVAALDPKLSPETALFLQDCLVSTPPAWAADESKAARLWQLSEEIIGQKLELS